MAFLKFSRDKRGYENYYLFDGKGRPRLLFWFRTPPQLKVGRAPFSDDVRKMIEAQNPGVPFDWARIIATPVPAPDVEHWRERRRVEKAAKRAARAAEAAEAAEAADAAGTPETGSVDEVSAEAEVVDDIVEQPVAAAGEDTEPREDAEAVMDALTAETTIAASESQIAASESPQAQPQGHRRRRRRRRGRRGGGGSPQTPQTPPGDEV